MTGIYESIIAISKEVGAIGKNSRNQQQGFNFRGIDDVMNTLHPLLAKHGVFIVPEVIEETHEEWQTARGNAIHSTKLKITYTFFAADGSSINATVIGEGMDSGDKSCNKAMAIAYKYACFQVFCIPTEEMVDPDKDSYEVQRPKKPSSQRPAAKTSAPKPQIPEEVQKSLDVEYNGVKLKDMFHHDKDTLDALRKDGDPEIKAHVAIIDKYLEGLKK